MKKALIALMLILSVYHVKAAPGDTTWVQAHNDIWLNYYNDFDTAIKFPDGSTAYRKVYMIFTLGKYQCPGNPQYCGDWDYTVQNFLMNKNGDTMELSRLITPYANVSYARFPWTWKERYVFDVTDYYPLLKDSATIRIHYSGYSGGFTANIKFAFVEGTPPRNVLGVTPLWHGSFGFGGSTPIDNNLTPVSKTAPSGAQSAEMKFTVTGHGSDGTGCSEFCKKYYLVMLNNNMLEQKDIWRDNCGFNHLYPQSGTWPYARGNWCPGDLVHTNSHVLTGVTGGSNYNLGVNFEQYTGSGGASYTIDANVVYYAGFNKTLDASLEDIIAPNNHEMHYRENPLAGNPIIHVRNTGSTPITSLIFAYGMDGTPLSYYQWQGTLAPLAESDVTLPEFWFLRTATGSNKFVVSLLNVNAAVGDDDATNNSLSSTFNAAPNWPSSIVIRFATNHAQNTQGFSENNWYVIEGMNDTIARRVNNAINTTYTDTVNLGPAAYKLVVSDDGCDGSNFWANTTQGAGTLTVRTTGSLTNLPLSGYFNGDFGCGFTQYFNVNWPTAITNINENKELGIDVFPNPANRFVTVTIAGINEVKGTLRVIDAMGKTVLTQHCDKAQETISTNEFANGMYTVIFIDEKANAKLQARLVIAK